MPQENTPVTGIPVTLPEGYCPTTWQQFMNDIFRLGNWFLPGRYRTFNYGSDEPLSTDRGNPWFRLNVDQSPDGWYTYFNGNWVAPYRVPASSNERMIWVGSILSLETYDGGESGSASPTTGPFWEEDTAFQARTAVGYGTLPDAAHVVTVGTTGGTDQVVLTESQNGPHVHTLDSIFSVNVGSGTGVATVKSAFGGGAIAVPDWTTSKSPNTTTAAPHQNMPPYLGVCFAKRTARVYKRA